MTPYFTDTTINGQWVMQLPDFRAVRYLKGDHERERMTSMHLNLAETDTLLDCGAETGDMSALFAGWVGSIQLMEPNPVVWPNMKAIFEANGIAPPTAHWVGFASDTCAMAETPSVADPFGLGWPDCANGELVAAHGFRHLSEETDTTPQITIDRFAHLVSPPTAITMDVEGAELQALKGATQLLQEARPLLWISVHPAFLRHHFGQRPADVYRFLEELDYRIVHLGDDHEHHIMAEPR